MSLKINHIIDNINFKYVKENDVANSNKLYKFKKYLFYLYALAKYQKLRHFTFFENTEIKINNSQFHDFSKRMKSIEGMSTIANAWIINQIASGLDKDQNYVNIGCWKGFSLIAGMINTTCKVFGVDNFSWVDAPRDEFYKNFNNYKNNEKHFFHDGDYVNFLKEWEKKNEYIDFYFFDGPHTYKDQYQSLELASNFFKTGTLILIDDTNWEEPREATMNFINKNSGKYKILHDLKCKHARHPTYWNGLIIFQKQ